jgi:hypothetical protein
MTGLRLLALATALTLALLAPSCIFRKSAKSAAPPPAPVPAQSASQPSAAKSGGTGQVALPPPPEISPQSPNLNQQPPASAEKLPPPPRRRKKKHPQQQEQTTQQPPAPATLPAEETAAAPVPQLEQILTPAQRQAYSDEIDADVGRAQKTVDTLQGRRLSDDHKTYLARVRAFIDQANDARKTDLFRAKNLAERASVLADDLLRSIQ